MDTTGIDNLKYIAGRPLDIGDDHFEPGDTVPARAIEQIPHLESFTSTGYLYIVTPNKGYDTLPPHVFSVVSTRTEALEIIAGDSGITLTSSIEATEAHASNPTIVRSEAESIINQDAKDSSLSPVAEKVLFEKGVSDVTPKEAEKNVSDVTPKEAEKNVTEAVKEDDEDAQGTDDAVAEKAEAPKPQARRNAKKG